MNAKYTLIGVVACALMMSGCATPENEYYSSSASGASAAPALEGKTREEVRSEVVQAYRDGTLRPENSEGAYPYVYPCTPQRAWQC